MTPLSHRYHLAGKEGDFLYSRQAPLSDSVRGHGAFCGGFGCGRHVEG